MSVFDRFNRNGATAPTEPSREGVEKATHVALGTPAAVRDVVTDTVARLRNPAQREKDVKSLREQMEKALKAAEKRGVEVRKKLPDQVESRLKVAEKRGEEARKRVVEQAKATRQRVDQTRERVTA